MRKLLHVSDPERTHNYQMQDGFSLVEVIIAVTLLAILTLPILAYFTNASVSTSKGENTQRANLAGETVMEELNAVESFEKLEAYAGAASGASMEVVSGTDKTVVKQDVSLDGFSYHVVADVDYSKYATVKTGSFNDYAVPQLKEVYSVNNAVFEETDQADTALSEFFCENPTTGKSDIVKDMTRTLNLEVVATKDLSRDIFWIKAYLQYEYKGKTKLVSIGNKKIERDKLENIYIFYKLLNSKSVENAKVSLVTDASVSESVTPVSSSEIENVKINYVLQNLPSIVGRSISKRPADYKLNVTRGLAQDAGFGYAKYFCNGFVLSGGVSAYTPSLVTTDTDAKRIAKITVHVYEYKEGSSYPESDCLVELESSKGAR